MPEQPVASVTMNPPSAGRNVTSVMPPPFLTHYPAPPKSRSSTPIQETVVAEQPEAVATTPSSTERLPQWKEALVKTDLPVQDVILERCWPYFLTEGIAFGLFGFMAVVLPAVLGAEANADFMGILFVMCATMQLVRAYTARELPGFLPSLIAAVFTLNIGALIFAYPTDRSISTPLGLCLFFMVQGVSNVFFSQNFRPFPYAQGFLFLGTLSGLFLFLMLIPNVWKDDILQNLLVGTELLLHGAILAGVALGLQRMARGQDALHPLATLQYNQYPFIQAIPPSQPTTQADATNNGSTGTLSSF
jgi:uncharacterized membrane protein HdeD (DUF308 family)